MQSASKYKENTLLVPMTQPQQKAKVMTIPRALPRMPRKDSYVPGSKVNDTRKVSVTEPMYSKVTHSTSPIKHHNERESRNEKMIKKSQSKSLVARNSYTMKKPKFRAESSHKFTRNPSR